MRYIYILFLAFFTIGVHGQSKTTENLQKKYSESQAFFFYNNTLRMVNLTEDKEFDELIKDIEKMKFLMIKRKVLKKQIIKVNHRLQIGIIEEIMTSRHDGKNFDVYMKDGKSKGMVVTVNDDQNLYVLDIVGTIPLNKVTKLFSTIDSSADIGKKIRDFAANHKSDDDHHKSDDDH